MMRVAVSGAAGRMGRLVAIAIAEASDLELFALYDPENPGETIAGSTVSDDPAAAAAADVVVEFTRPDVVMDNLERWRTSGVHAVVGTSGFDEDAISALRAVWEPGPPNCFIAPNFSVGAVLMMRFAELAAPHFAAAEVVELHHDAKVDAPSGTALATAERIAGAAGTQRRAAKSHELVPGARGAAVAGIPVHAIRLTGFVAHQEVIFGDDGQILTIRHDTMDRASFLPGVMLAVRSVAELAGVTVGLEHLLGL